MQRDCNVGDASSYARPMGTDPDQRWKVSAWSATALAREASGRDIAVHIVPETACSETDFDPNTHTIRVLADAVGLSDESPPVLVDSLISRLRSPVLAGVVLAGAARAAHSRWIEDVPDDGPAELCSAAWQLDRARAKARLIARRPQDRLFLRAAARQLLLAVDADTQAGGDVTRTVVTDLLPEVDCGVLPRWIGPKLRQLAEDDLGVPLMNRLTDLWREVQLVADGDTETVLELARQWLDLWDQRPNPPSSRSLVSTSLLTAANNALAQVADEAATDAIEESILLVGSGKSPTQKADDREADLATTHAGVAFGPTSRTPIKHRTPTLDDHRRRATTVQRLRRAQYRAPHTVGVPVGYPTGRARGDALMQRAAQRAQGVAVTALPWKQRQWRSVPKPPIRAGIVVDLSGSMSPWLPAAGTAIWSMAAAVDELGGSTAATGFAGAVFPLLRPRTAPARVPVLSQKGGSDGCAAAMAAVTAAADLARPGAAIMIVLTDSHLPPADLEPIERHAHYLRRHGVQLIWALIGTRTRQTVIPRDARVIEQVTPDNFPTLVADAIAAALTAEPV